MLAVLIFFSAVVQSMYEGAATSPRITDVQHGSSGGGKKREKIHRLHISMNTTTHQTSEHWR